MNKALNKFRKQSALLAALVFLVLVSLFYLGRQLLLQTRAEQFHLQQMVDLQTHKALLQDAVESNFFMIWGLEAFLTVDENSDLRQPRLSSEIQAIGQRLSQVSNHVTDVVVVTGYPQSAWTSTFGFSMQQQNNKDWSLEPQFKALANDSFKAQSLISQVVLIDQQQLLLVVKPYSRREKHKGFILAVIDFSKLMLEYKQLIQNKNTTKLSIPKTGLPEFQHTIEAQTPFLELNFKNQGEVWKFFSSVSNQSNNPIFPIWIAIPFVFGIALGFAFLSYSINFERLKSHWFSLFDPLTGVANRRYLENYFSKQEKGGLLLFNIDNFRKINEQYGFAVGDLVLLEVVSRIQQSLRPIDFLARLGNDEFVIFVSLQKRNDANIIANKIQQSMTEPMLINNQIISLVTIIGSSFYPQHGTQLSALVEYADHHLNRTEVLESARIEFQ